MPRGYRISRDDEKSPIVKEYIDLHNSGYSTSEIAKILDKKKNTVIQSLRKYGILRRALGRDVEDEVAIWTCHFASSCFKMPGDCPFDLLVNGVRVNVKSSSLGKRGYSFAIRHKQSKSDYHKHVDEFYLVFLGSPGRPVYRLPSSYVNVSYGIGIPVDISQSKYPLQFLGFLDGGER